MWGFLADLVVLAHLAYLLFVGVGGFLVLRHIGWLYPHLAVLGWGVLGIVQPLGCPVTALEKWLRLQDGATAYDGTFIGHYLDGPVWPEGARDQVWLATALVVLASYALVAERRWLHPRAVAP